MSLIPEDALALMEHLWSTHLWLWDVSLARNSPLPSSHAPLSSTQVQASSSIHRILVGLLSCTALEKVQPRSYWKLWEKMIQSPHAIRYTQCLEPHMYLIQWSTLWCKSHRYVCTTWWQMTDDKFHMRMMVRWPVSLTLGASTYMNDS